MEPSSVVSVHRAYLTTHERILKLAEGLTETQLGWQAGPTSPAIAFHVWHLARWADHLQAALPGMTEELSRRLGPRLQIWDAEGIEQQWRLANQDLGVNRTGMGVGTTDELHLPQKATLLEYVRRAFAAADQAVQQVDAEQFAAPEQPQGTTDGVRNPEGTVGDALLVHLTHENRHLGMIECLIGLQGAAGTATL